MRHNLNRDSAGYSITSATRPGGANKKPRSSTVALSDCVCYDADGNVTRIIARTASPSRKQRTSKRTPVQSTVTPTRYDSRRDLILAATMGTVHDS